MYIQVIRNEETEQFINELLRFNCVPDVRRYTYSTYISVTLRNYGYNSYVSISGNFLRIHSNNDNDEIMLDLKNVETIYELD